MKHPLHFRRVARAEYVRAIGWYEEQKPGLGARFEAHVEAVLDIISRQPNRYALVEGEVREASVRRFPYSVFYRVESARIVVIAVFHQSRDPSEWQSRS
jgi:plasmid stabilization system protein ParE